MSSKKVESISRVMVVYWFLLSSELQSSGLMVGRFMMMEMMMVLLMSVGRLRFVRLMSGLMVLCIVCFQMMWFCGRFFVLVVWIQFWFSMLSVFVCIWCIRFVMFLRFIVSIGIQRCVSRLRILVKDYGVLIMLGLNSLFMFVLLSCCISIMSSSVVRKLGMVRFIQFRKLVICVGMLQWLKVVQMLSGIVISYVSVSVSVVINIVQFSCLLMMDVIGVFDVKEYLKLSCVIMLVIQLRYCFYVGWLRLSCWVMLVMVFLENWGFLRYWLIKELGCNLMMRKYSIEIMSRVGIMLRMWCRVQFSMW